MKVASPWYAAVMLCVAAESVEIVSVAWPSAFKVPVPMLVLPSRNLTVPPGEPLPVTVAVKVTESPKFDGFSDEVSPVDEARPLTV